jgi:hypothetical protein
VPVRVFLCPRRLKTHQFECKEGTRMTWLVFLLSLSGNFATSADQPATAQEGGRMAVEELEWGVIEAGNSVGIQFFPKRRVSLFPLFEKGVVVTIGSVQGGSLRDITLERQGEKGRILDRIQARRADVRFAGREFAVRLTLRDGSCCVDGWIKRSFEAYEVRIPLLPGGK